MPQNYSTNTTGVHLVTASGEEELTQAEYVQFLQLLRLKNIPYCFGCGNKEK